MSIKIVKGSYSSVVDSASLSGNQTLTLPNASGTVALTNQFATVATSGAYNDLSGKPTLAKVATSGSYNDLSNKPSIPSTPKGYITQTWRSGNNWYRVYSDGWIEQGGYLTSSGSTTNISYHKKFSNTNYHILTTQRQSSDNAFSSNFSINSSTRTTSGCRVYSGTTQYGCGFDWFGMGN